MSCSAAPVSHLARERRTNPVPPGASLEDRPHSELEGLGLVDRARVEGLGHTEGHGREAVQPTDRDAGRIPESVQVEAAAIIRHYLHVCTVAGEDVDNGE